MQTFFTFDCSKKVPLVTFERKLSNAHFFALSVTAGKYQDFQQDSHRKGPQGLAQFPKTKAKQAPAEEEPWHPSSETKELLVLQFVQRLLRWYWPWQKCSYCNKELTKGSSTLSKLPLSSTTLGGSVVLPVVTHLQPPHTPVQQSAPPARPVLSIHCGARRKCDIYTSAIAIVIQGRKGLDKLKGDDGSGAEGSADGKGELEICLLAW